MNTGSSMTFNAAVVQAESVASDRERSLAKRAGQAAGTGGRSIIGLLEGLMSVSVRLLAVTFGLAIALSTGSSLAQGVGPKPLPRLTCSADQRILFEIYPVQSPMMLRIWKTNWGETLDSAMTGFLLGGLPGAAERARRSVKTEDYTEEMTRGVTAALSGVDVEQMLLEATARMATQKTPCQTVFVKTEERRKATLAPTDRVVMVLLYFSYAGGKPRMTARLGAALVSKVENLPRIDESLLRMKAISDEVQSSRMPSLSIRKPMQLLKLARETEAYSDWGHKGMYTSGAHEVKEWVADGSRLVLQELTVAIDRLAGELGGALF